MSPFDLRIGESEPADAASAEALRSFARAARNEPGDPDYDYMIGDALLRGGRTREALEHCRDAVRLDRENPDYQLALGRALWRLGRFEEAEPAFREAVRRRPDAVAHNALGATLLQLDRLGDAERALRLALRADPSLAEAYGNLAAVYWERGRRGHALALLERAARMAPQDRGTHRNLGIALLHSGRADEAAAAFRAAIACGDADAGAHLDLAEALAEGGRGEEAGLALAEATRLDPGAIAKRPAALQARDALRRRELHAQAAADPPAPPSFAGVLARVLAFLAPAPAGAKGASRGLATLLLACALGLLVVAGGRIAPHWFRHFLLHDDLAGVARAPVDDEANVRDRLAHAVSARGLRAILDPETCVVQRRPGWRRITCAYDVPVEVLPGWTHALAFQIDVEQPFVVAALAPRP